MKTFFFPSNTNTRFATDKMKNKKCITDRIQNKFKPEGTIYNQMIYNILPHFIFITPMLHLIYLLYEFIDYK